MTSEVIKDLGIFAGGSTLLYFLFRSLFKHILSKDIEKFRSDLRLVAIEHEIRFSRLHERRMEIIAELYGYLSLIEQEFIKGIDALALPNDTSKEPTFSKLNELGEGFRKFYISNRIYLDEEICDKINAFSSEIGAPFLEFLDGSKGTGKRSRQELNKLLSEFLKKHKENLESIMCDIEREFRALLGVKRHS